MMGKLDEIRDLAEELGSLRERRRGIDLQMKELEARLAALTGTTKRTESSDGENQVLGLLDKSPEIEFDVKKIQPLLPDLKPPTIRAAFSRLHSAHKIERLRHGTYRSLLGKK